MRSFGGTPGGVRTGARPGGATMFEGASRTVGRAAGAPGTARSFGTTRSFGTGCSFGSAAAGLPAGAERGGAEVTGSTRLTFCCVVAPARGASCTEPDVDAAGLAATIGRAAAAAAGTTARFTTGALFCSMTASFCWNVGGAGGGAERVTTVRDAIAGGGAVAAAGRAATRIEAAVGRTGTRPTTTGAAATWRTVAASWITAPETAAPETNVVC